MIHYADDWLTVYQGDCRAVMAGMEPESVHCVVTSPPYWGLRDYGEAGQLGLEPTPELYVAAMVEVFRAVRRVLRADGTVWLNLGDSYAADRGLPSSGTTTPSRRRDGVPIPRSDSRVIGLKSKDLVGIPWMLAFALRADGWYLRSDVIWSKPNPMPEAVKDRPTTSHEHVFLLTRSQRYFYDARAAREPVNGGAHARRRVRPDAWQSGPGSHTAVEHSRRERAPGVTPKSTEPGHGIKANASFHAAVVDLVTDRNLRTVWTIPSQPYSGAHFATFPEALVEPCIKAGSPEGGTVLDPFGGSGTTARVANRLSRKAVLIDLSTDYLDQAMTRNAQSPMGLVG